MIDKAKIAARIRALSQKTVENGCTEDEAASAAAMVADLLAKYNLTLDECQVRENGFARAEHRGANFVGERLWKIADALSYMIGVRYWAEQPGEPPKITFFGFDHEVEIATYLLEICERAMSQRLSELDFEYRLLRESARRRRVMPFLDGMADRLAFRIRELKPQEPVGTGLIVLKNDLIDAELVKEGVKLGDRTSRQSRDFEPDYARGRAAGDAVALNPGIRAEQVAGRIAAQ